MIKKILITTKEVLELILPIIWNMIKNIIGGFMLIFKTIRAYCKRESYISKTWTDGEKADFIIVCFLLLNMFVSDILWI